MKIFIKLQVSIDFSTKIFISSLAPTPINAYFQNFLKFFPKFSLKFR